MVTLLECDGLALNLAVEDGLLLFELLVQLLQYGLLLLELLRLLGIAGGHELLLQFLTLSKQVCLGRGRGNKYCG